MMNLGGNGMIKLNDVSKIYNKNKDNEFYALNKVSLSIESGELVAITGNSGAGKSTLLHILACIDNYDEGEYYLDGKLIKNISERQAAQIRNEKVGIVMQDYALIEDITAIENVMIPLDFSMKKINKKQRSIDTLKMVNMDNLYKKQIRKMSGGQKQRVAIARAIVNNPKILLADEPTGALDNNSSSEIMNIFYELNKKGMTIIIVTHDLSLAKKCNRIIKISDGKIV